jgi:hypothetical protein
MAFPTDCAPEPITVIENHLEIDKTITASRDGEHRRGLTPDCAVKVSLTINLLHRLFALSVFRFFSDWNVKRRKRGISLHGTASKHGRHFWAAFTVSSSFLERMSTT